MNADVGKLPVATSWPARRQRRRSRAAADGVARHTGIARNSADGSNPMGRTAWGKLGVSVCRRRIARLTRLLSTAATAFGEHRNAKVRPTAAELEDYRVLPELICSGSAGIRRALVQRQISADPALGFATPALNAVFES